MKGQQMTRVKKQRKVHFSRHCQVCKRLIHGTVISLANHEENCLTRKHGQVQRGTKIDKQ